MGGVVYTLTYSAYRAVRGIIFDNDAPNEMARSYNSGCFKTP